MAQPTILLADDDAGIRLVASRTLIADDYQVRSTTNPAALMRWIQNGEGDVLVSDVYMGDDCIFDYMDDIRRLRPDLPIIIISGQSTLTTAVSARETGAFDYLPKPFDIDRLSDMVRSALASRKSSKQSSTTRTDSYIGDDHRPIIGDARSLSDHFAGQGYAADRIDRRRVRDRQGALCSGDT